MNQEYIENYVDNSQTNFYQHYGDQHFQLENSTSFDIPQ